MKKFFCILILFFSSFNDLFAITTEELKEYTYVDFYNFVTSYNVNNKNIVNNVYNNKKIDITSTAFNTYINPPQKYITFLEYRGASRTIDTYQKPFLLDWFKIAGKEKSFKLDDGAQSILVDENFGLFYTSTMYSTKGRSYFLTTQKAVNDSMEKELKLGNLIKVYIWNLGQYSANIPVMVIIGYEKVPTISKAIKDKMYFQDYLPVLKDDIFNRKFDKAKGNIELLLKKYPNNIDLKLNLCMIFNQTGFYDKSINCYKNILTENSNNYDAYYGISVAYYNNKTLNIKTKSQYIIENTTKSLDIINSLTSKPTGTMEMIFINCYYLRAMAKMEIGNDTAIDDLNIVHLLQPVLVSSESLELFKKRFKK